MLLKFIEAIQKEPSFNIIYFEDSILLGSDMYILPIHIVCTHNLSGPQLVYIFDYDMSNFYSTHYVNIYTNSHVLGYK